MQLYFCNCLTPSIIASVKEVPPPGSKSRRLICEIKLNDQIVMITNLFVSHYKRAAVIPMQLYIIFIVLLQNLLYFLLLVV